MNNNNNTNQNNLKRSSLFSSASSSSSPSAATASAAAEGHKATHGGLNSLLQDLLSTVKFLRKQHIEQNKRIEILSRQIDLQQRVIDHVLSSSHDNKEDEEEAGIGNASISDEGVNTKGCTNEIADDACRQSNSNGSEEMEEEKREQQQQQILNEVNEEFGVPTSNNPIPISNLDGDGKNTITTMTTKTEEMINHNIKNDDLIIIQLRQELMDMINSARRQQQEEIANLAKRIDDNNNKQLECKCTCTCSNGTQQRKLVLKKKKVLSTATSKVVPTKVVHQKSTTPLTSSATTKHKVVPNTTSTTTTKKVVPNKSAVTTKVIPPNKLGITATKSAVVAQPNSSTATTANHVEQPNNATMANKAATVPGTSRPDT